MSKAAAPQGDGHLGLSGDALNHYEVLREVGGYKYETPPGVGYSTKDAVARWVKVAGALNPKFTPDTFDLARERVQTMEKKERRATLEAIGILYASKCGERWYKDPGVDHAEFERMLNPNYAPKFADARRALDLPPPSLWWKYKRYESLENISRIPLSNCDLDRSMQMSFEEWYQLFWNYGMPFNPTAFYCLATSQHMIFTREFVDELADYLKLRLECDLPHENQPVLMYGARVGKLAKLLNDTKRVPVPVISACEEPTRNPYLLAIPPHCQKKFTPAPNEKLKLDTALEKYKPAIVLLPELVGQQDITQDVRAHGCVKEYLTIGMPNSMIEGHGFLTFGGMRWLEETERHKNPMPPSMRDGFKRYMLCNISRYGIHRFDQRLVHGVSAVMSFHRGDFTFDLKRRWKWFKRRLVTRY